MNNMSKMVLGKKQVNNLIKEETGIIDLVISKRLKIILKDRIEFLKTLNNNTKVTSEFSKISNFITDEISKIEKLINLVLVTRDDVKQVRLQYQELNPKYVKPTKGDETDDGIDDKGEPKFKKLALPEIPLKIPKLIITIPEGYTEIEEGAFEYTKISKVIFPSSMKKSGINSFSNCKKLLELVLNEGLEELWMIKNCKNLKIVNIPNSLKFIELNMFENCPSLENKNLGVEILNDLELNGLGTSQIKYELQFSINNIMLQKKQAINVKIELPMLTVENAIRYGNGKYGDVWFYNKESRKKFIDWMKTELSERTVCEPVKPLYM